MIFCVREIWSVRRLQTTAVTLFLSVLLLACAAARAEDGISSRDSLHLAVAADFSEVARRLADDFSAEAGVPVTITSDTSGVLTSKIRDGATFDVFLSADSKRPQELIEAAGSHFGETAHLGEMGSAYTSFVPSIELSRKLSIGSRSSAARSRLSQTTGIR